MPSQAEHDAAAKFKFDTISEQLLNRWGIKHVIEFQRLVENGINLIVSNPFIFQIIEENLQVRKGYIHKNCSIIYRINELKIEVICFYDNRQEPIF